MFSSGKHVNKKYEEQCEKSKSGHKMILLKKSNFKTVDAV